MSMEFLSALRGGGLGTVIGSMLGLATLGTMGFNRIDDFEGVLLVSCSIFGGFLFGFLIVVTGAFRKEPQPAESAAPKTTVAK